MFAIAFIPYRILSCFKRIIFNAGAKLQKYYEIFLRTYEKVLFLTFKFHFGNSIRLITPEATFVGHGFLSFFAFSLGVSFLGSPDLFASTAVSAVFCCPSISGSISHIIAPF